jgi:hypothetical protein
MVIALAGRRVDAANAATPRFPAAQLDKVRAELETFFTSHGVTALVCAAACGADILALEVAGELRLRRRIVLPFARADFRAMSVVDRGGAWGERYDALLTAVEAQGDLVEGAHDKDDMQTFFTGNLDILDQAQWLAQQTGADAAALVVWDGQSRGPDDVTGHFKQEAEARGLGVAEVLTT